MFLSLCLLPLLIPPLSQSFSVLFPVFVSFYSRTDVLQHDESVNCDLIDESVNCDLTIALVPLRLWRLLGPLLERNEDWGSYETLAKDAPSWKD